jgi:hypothetical protein
LQEYALLLDTQYAYLILKISEICLRVFLKKNLIFTWKNVKNLSKSVWVEAGELKFCMNMLYLFKLKTAYSDLELEEFSIDFLIFFF